jgi:hypothetical protein
MKAIKICYEHKLTFSDGWVHHEYIPKDIPDYHRVIDLIHSKQDEYRIVNVERVDKEW